MRKVSGFSRARVRHLRELAFKFIKNTFHHRLRDLWVPRRMHRNRNDFSRKRCSRCVGYIFFLPQVGIIIERYFLRLG